MKKLIIFLQIMFLSNFVIAQENGTYDNLSIALQNPEDVKELILLDGNITDLLKIDNLVNLEILRISSSNLETIPKEICNLHNLKDLQLEDNRIAKLPKELGNLTNLQRLFLNENLLTEIPAEIGKLQKLTYLNLGGNKLETLPVEISKLEKLEHLDLSSNTKMRFSEVFNNLKGLNLNSISLSATGQKYLPNTITELKSLEEIDLTFLDIFLDFEYTFNQLDTLPNLKHLDISRNPELKELPQNIINLKKIESINLDGNYNLDIQAEIEKLQHLPSLKILDIGSLGLKIIPDNVYKLLNLETIILSGNDKLNFDISFFNLSKIKNLKSLSLFNCNIETISTKLKDIKTLEDLDLMENPNFKIMKSLKTLKECKNLKSINLLSFSPVNYTSEEIKKLKSELPKVNIAYWE